MVLLVALTLRLARALRPDPTVSVADIEPIAFEDIDEPTATPEPKPTPTPTPTPVPTPEQQPSEEPANSASELNLAVPFVSQAPFGIWDAFHEETCEEASFLMALAFYDGDSTLDATEADNRFYDMVAVEESLGMGVSISVAEAEQFIEHYFNRQITIYENPTVADIKSLVASGRPVIVPAAGRKLGNPFFTGAGPLYHMLVIRGYTEDVFITNDPGTRHGQNYTYDAGVLMGAIADWNNGDPEHGAKRVFVIEP